jgi:hypothetical protein
MLDDVDLLVELWLILFIFFVLLLLLLKKELLDVAIAKETTSKTLELRELLNLVELILLTQMLLDHLLLVKQRLRVVIFLAAIAATI